MNKHTERLLDLQEANTDRFIDFDKKREKLGLLYQLYFQIKKLLK